MRKKLDKGSAVKKIKQGKVISPSHRQLQLGGLRRHLKGSGHVG